MIFQKASDKSKEKIRIAVIDDEKMILNVFSSIMRQFGYQADFFTNSFQAFEAIVNAAGAYQLVVSDIRMAGMDGITFAKKIRVVYPQLPFIFMTGDLTEEIKSEAEKLGRMEMFQKPFPLVATLNEAIKKLVGP